MLITVTCPFCGKRSKINAEKQGKKLRCPYPDCRQSFTVPVEEAAVPTVEVEVVDAPAEPSWQAAPPPVRQADVETPVEAPWEAPAARSNGEEAYEPYTPQLVEEPVEAAAPVVNLESLYAPVHRRKHRSIWVMLIGIGIVGMLCLLAVVFILKNRGRAEEQGFEQADAEFQKGNYPEAKRRFEALVADYPSSEKRSTYEFMAELSDLSVQAGSSTIDPNTLIKRVNTFARKPKVPDLLKAYRGETWDALVRLGVLSTVEAERKTDPEMVKSAGGFLELAKDVGPGTKQKDEADKRYADLQAKIKQAGVKVAAALAKKDTLAQLDTLFETKQPQAVEQADQLIDQAIRFHPFLAKDTEIAAKKADFRRAEPEWVRYQREPKELPRGPVAGKAEAGGSGFVVCPVVAGSPGKPAEGDGVVFALARGVLYALSQSSGEPRWFMRVGIDTQMLPVRLPAEPPLPEMALVFSTDTNTLSAVEVLTGKTHWHFQMEAPCTAAPILVGRRAFVPTTDGKLHEIDTSRGYLQGRFETGQPLTLPGTHDPATGRLYVPADKKRIYILDTDKQQCLGVFYSDHPVGGLRAPPIVVSQIVEARRLQTLVLIESTDLQTTKVRGFAVPEAGAEAKITQAIEYAVTGWSWFPPHFDGETLGLVTDRGVLALFGVNRGTADRPLFSLTRQETGENQGIVVDASAHGSGRPFGRAQVVDAHLNEWWLLIGGQLRRYRFDLYRRQLHPVGTQGLTLGTPLHDRQTQFRDRLIVVVSQESDHRSVVSAIDSTTGALRWQRQLGLAGRQAPLAVGDKLVAMDQSGGLVQFDPANGVGKNGTVNAGEWLANGLEPTSPPVLLQAPDRRFAVAVIYLAKADQVVLRKIEPGKAVVERVYPLLTPPAGIPAVTSNSVLLPCRDGNFYELLLEGPPDVPIGLAWRHRNAQPSAAGHAVALGPDEVILTDGWRTLHRWQRGSEGDRQWRRSQGGIELNGRLATPPLVMADGSDRLICIGDDNGTVHLRSLTRPGSSQEWVLQTLLKDAGSDHAPEIIRGPFACATRIGVIVAPGRLVVLDPKASAPLWDLAVNGGIAGEPQVVGNLVLVAETAGRFVWLDALRGQPKAEVAAGEALPAAGGVPFGQGHALVPLMDGTLLVLPVPN